MANPANPLEAVVLDEYGRVVLSEDQLKNIESFWEATSAGGLNGGCPSSTNNQCTNSLCTGSLNRNGCTNQVECSGSTNGHCPSPPLVDEG